jgi:hypothetical protein
MGWPVVPVPDPADVVGEALEEQAATVVAPIARRPTNITNGR